MKNKKEPIVDLIVACQVALTNARQLSKLDSDPLNMAALQAIIVAAETALYNANKN